MNGNVIDFNAVRSKMMERRLDEIAEETVADEEFVRNFSESVARDIVDAMEDFGYDILANPECIKDIVAIIEATEALLQRAVGVETSFQKISDHLFVAIFGEEDAEKVFSSFLDAIDD